MRTSITSSSSSTAFVPAATWTTSNSSSFSSYSSFSSSSLKSGAKADQFSLYCFVHTKTAPLRAQHVRIGRVGWHAISRPPSFGCVRCAVRWPFMSQMLMHISSEVAANPITCSESDEKAA